MIGKIQQFLSLHEIMRKAGIAAAGMAALLIILPSPAPAQTLDQAPRQAPGPAQPQAQAPAPAQEGPVLTMQEAVRRAVANAPELGEAQSDIDLMKAKFAEAKGYRFPQLDVLGLTGPVPRARGNQISSPDTGSSLDDLGWFERADATLVQPLYTFGKITNAETAATHGVKVENARREQKKNEIALKTKEYYYSVLLAREMKELLTEVREDLNKATDTAKKLLDKESENVEEADLFKLAAFNGEVGNYLAQAEKGETLALSALAVRMGGSPTEVPNLGDQRLLPVDDQLQRFDAYVERAKEQRPEFIQVSEGLKARSALVEGAKAARYPDVFLGGYLSAAYATNRDKVDNPWIQDNFRHVWGGVALGLKWKLDFGITSAKIAQEQAQYEKLLSTKSFAEENIPLQIRKFYDEGVQARSALAETKTGYENSKKWAVTSSSNFDFGIGPAKDIFDSLQQYAKMRAAYFQAIFDYNMSIANLCYATGESPL